MSRLPLSFLITLVAPAAFGEIRYVAAKKLWRLEAGPVSYVIGINERNELESRYWGKRLWRDDDLATAHSLPEWASFDLSRGPFFLYMPHIETPPRARSG